MQKEPKKKVFCYKLLQKQGRINDSPLKKSYIYKQKNYAKLIIPKIILRNAPFQLIVHSFVENALMWSTYILAGGMVLPSQPRLLT